MIFGGLASPVLALMSPSPVAVGLSSVALVIIIALLWRADEPPILLLPVLFQWTEVAAYPLATIWKQVPINDLSALEGDLEFSALFGFAGVISLALGLKLGSDRRVGLAFGNCLEAEARSWLLSRIMWIGLGAVALGYIFNGLRGLYGPANELFGALSTVKSLGVFIITYWCFLNHRNYFLFASVAMFEILFGMTGFFADFKFSLLSIFIGVLSARKQFRFSDVFTGGVLVAFVMLVAVFWTAIKSDYRLMINQGSGAQSIDVPLIDRLEFITDSVFKIDGEMLAKGFDQLVFRHGYIEYLSLVIENVPAFIPHENGQLTLNVISHILMPRLFFPDKPALPSDTEVTRNFTLLNSLGNENTSISIGNLGELYIDFGFFGGLFGEFCIGLIISFVYNVLKFKSGSSALISAGVCIMIVLPIAYFGTAYIKLIGVFLYTSIAAIVMQWMYIKLNRDR